MWYLIWIYLGMFFFIKGTISEDIRNTFKCMAALEVAEIYLFVVAIIFWPAYVWFLYHTRGRYKNDLFKP